MPTKKTKEARQPVEMVEFDHTAEPASMAMVAQADSGSTDRLARADSGSMAMVAQADSTEMDRLAQPESGSMDKPRPATAGRHEKDEPRRAAFVEALAATGIVALACKAARLRRQTAYEWRERDPTFAAEWESAKQESVDLLEAEAVRRARNGSDNLLMFLLKKERPEFRDYQPGGANVTINLQQIDATIERQFSQLADIQTKLQARRGLDGLPPLALPFAPGSAAALPAAREPNG